MRAWIHGLFYFLVFETYPPDMTFSFFILQWLRSESLSKLRSWRWTTSVSHWASGEHARDAYARGRNEEGMASFTVATVALRPEERVQ
jgi:hypothetical protein